MVEATTDTEALLADSRNAIEILRRLTARLEVYTDRLEHEVDRLDEDRGRRDARGSAG